jgi:hypothetical protein
MQNNIVGHPEFISGSVTATKEIFRNKFGMTGIQKFIYIAELIDLKKKGGYRKRNYFFFR